MIGFRSGKGAARFAERRQREDDAQRLHDAVPSLDTLRLEVSERREEAPVAEVEYVRHVVVARAPALFVLQCTDKSCQDGEYDITHEVLHGLRRGETRIAGTERCTGSRGTASCGRVIDYVVVATYR